MIRDDDVTQVDDEDIIDDVEITPVDDARCGLCGRVLVMIQAGQPVPAQEPLNCEREREGAWSWCAGIREGWTRLTYVAGRTLFGTTPAQTD